MRMNANKDEEPSQRNVIIWVHYNFIFDSIDWRGTREKSDAGGTFSRRGEMDCCSGNSSAALRMPLLPGVSFHSRMPMSRRLCGHFYKFPLTTNWYVSNVDTNPLPKRWIFCLEQPQRRNIHCKWRPTNQISAMTLAPTDWTALQLEDVQIFSSSSFYRNLSLSYHYCHSARLFSPLLVLHLQPDPSSQGVEEVTLGNGRNLYLSFK